MDLTLVDTLIERLRVATWKERDGIREELLALALPANSETLRQHLEEAKKTLPLEAKWEVDEVLLALRPPPPVVEEELVPEPPPEEPKGGQLRMSDLEDVYSDPGGNVIFRHKKTPSRWFIQQVHPQTGQPVMGELSPPEVEQLKVQLKGSPYWRLGSGM